MERIVICDDAFKHLQDTKVRGSIITSLPDADDQNWSIAHWRNWFSLAVQLCLRATPDRAMCIFYQTDRKAGGRQIAKDRMIMDLACEIGFGEPIWHKIAITKRVGGVNLYRPGYSHMLAFSMKCGPGPATPDVIEAGEKLYPDAMGISAAHFMVGHALRVSNHITDPFCGRGTVLACADALGVDSLGIDIDQAQCASASAVSVFGKLHASTGAS